MTQETVLVTGASGYIGLHAIKQLLDQGYSVRGTVRSMKREGEIREALSKSGSNSQMLTLVEADLLKDQGWDEAVQGCSYVLHIASPFFIGEPDDENEMIKPAVEGTVRVLTAAAKAGVKKVVQTSSCAAITDTFDGKERYSEADWSRADHPKCSAYYKSKTLAEMAAWDFMASDQSGMSLSVINPVMVVGPSLTDDIGTSNSVIERLINGSLPAAIRHHLGYVDVRDVAAAHILAMTNPASDGERFIVSERELWMAETAAVLREAGFRKAPKITLPNFVVRVVALFDKDVGSALNTLGKPVITPSDKARKILGWQPRDVRQSVVETAKQLEQMGLAA